MRWISETLQPLGDDDATIQITVLPERGIRHGLLTVRCKDQDLTAKQFEELGKACLMAAERIKRGK